jgi:hypothetical protein
MQIKDNKIELNNSLIEIGMSFSKVEKAVEDVISDKYVPKENDEDGYGHITIRNEFFYDLYAIVNLIFRKGVLLRVVILPDCKKYDLKGPDGRTLSPFEYVDQLFEISANGLIKAFGKNWYNLKGTDIYVLMSRGREGEGFSVNIKRLSKATIKLYGLKEI